MIFGSSIYGCANLWGKLPKADEDRVGGSYKPEEHPGHNALRRIFSVESGALASDARVPGGSFGFAAAQVTLRFHKCHQLLADADAVVMPRQS